MNNPDDLYTVRYLAALLLPLLLVAMAVWSIILSFHSSADVLRQVCNAQPHPMRMMYNQGFLKQLGLENLCVDMDAAIQRARVILSGK